jgi:RNA polymerase sigma factor (sigma-70 family)
MSLESDAIFIDKDGNQFLPEDIIADERDYIQEMINNTENHEQLDIITQIINKRLTDLEKKCLITYYFDELTQAKVAQESNISQSYACRVISRAIDKILFFYEIEAKKRRMEKYA